jgi:hypothetical protein
MCLFFSLLLVPVESRVVKRRVSAGVPTVDATVWTSKAGRRKEKGESTLDRLRSRDRFAGKFNKHHHRFSILNCNVWFDGVDLRGS